MHSFETVSEFCANFPQDVEYYNQTLDGFESNCIVKFPSDVKLAKHPRMADEWKRFVGDQHHWNEVCEQVLLITGTRADKYLGLRSCLYTTLITGRE